jgi:hypothetical protein
MGVCVSVYVCLCLFVCVGIQCVCVCLCLFVLLCFLALTRAQTVPSPKLKTVLQAAYSIVATAHNDIQRMYTLVLDTVQVTIPDIANNITGTARLVVEAIQSLVDCPVAATYALIVAKDHITTSIARLLFLKTQFEEAFFISTGQLPVWLSPTKEVFRILAEFVNYIKYHLDVTTWGCDTATPRKPTECFVNRSQYDQEMEMRVVLSKVGVIGDILNFVTETVMPPINKVTQLYADIINTWDFMKMM